MRYRPFRYVSDLRGLLFKLQTSSDLRPYATSVLVLFGIADFHIKYMLVKGCRILFPPAVVFNPFWVVTLNRRLRIDLYSARTLVIAE